MKNVKSKSLILLAIICLMSFCIGLSVNGLVAQAEEGAGQMSFANVAMNMYNPAKDTGYTLTNKVDKNAFDATAYTSLRIDVQEGRISNSFYKGFNAFGVTGTSVNLNFKINYNGGINETISGEWLLSGDSWGDDDGENINGVQSGQVLSGGLIIQTSNDGVTWSNENKGKYTNGLYTTDYYTHYETTEQIIYTPSGNDLSKGLFIRVLYAYEIYDYIPCSHKNGWYWITGQKWEHENDNVWLNYVEEYSFYICYDSADAVTFHNLTIEGELEENLKDEDASMIELIKKAETLLDGSVTSTGFVIDKTLCEAADVTIKKNGQGYIVPTNNTITENGRYDINVTTALGQEKTTTIYVFSTTKEDMYSLYFGNSFLSGKRIYSEGKYPVYEGGLSFYNLQSITGSVPALWGSIKNKTTGKEIVINPTTSYQQGLLVEAGDYEAIFNTNITYNSNDQSGDNHVVRFNFTIIKNGSAPGPQVNKKSLNNYSNMAMPSNLHSTYYGVTFQSAHKGYITVAFANKKDAIDYAYNYEKGMVEVQSDGSYRYNGSLVVSQKVKYESAWDLTDAVYYFAEQAVQKLRFDLSDEFTYLTLSEEVLSTISNLRTLELVKSVVVFADDSQKQALIKSGNIPVINYKKYSYLTPGAQGGVDAGIEDFMFVKDVNGYDSNKVTITDSKGIVYSIEYNTGVGMQLYNYGCNTGMVTITEETVYGDTTTYQAAYIAENDNTSTINLTCYDKQTTTSKTLNKNNNGHEYETNAFSVESIIDNFDPYGTIIIDFNGGKEFYCFDEKNNKKYTQKGIYKITLLNRFGYSYSFTIKIEEELYYLTQIMGDGIETSYSIMYSDGETINLPTLTKYGYNFVGYKGVNGTIYSNEVLATLLKANAVLETVWEAKQFNLTLENNGSVYKTQTMAFGEIYTLPVLASNETTVFVGWKNAEGNFISSYKVDTEGDLRLFAVFETVNAEDPSVETEEAKKALEWWLWLILIVLAIIGFVIIVIFNEGNVFIAIMGLVLFILCILCMIWPTIFMWWYF